MPSSGIDAADGAGRVVTDPEGRGEKANAHRENDDHRIVDVVHADLTRDGEKQRAEQHDGGNTFEYAAQDHEGDDGHGEEDGHAARQGRS